ncbi:MAG: hypothetical protein K2K09_05165 [Lachnospiraceae bacterium]|nr:hypothetical protein [Lachnospiraceae bacterium]
MFDKCIACGKLTSYDKICIVKMCLQVAAALAANNEKTSKGVKYIMGGKILDYDAKDNLRQGMEQTY